MEVVEEAEGRTRLSVEDKKKALRKAGKDDKVDEDDPEKFKQSVKVKSLYQAYAEGTWHSLSVVWLFGVRNKMS